MSGNDAVALVRAAHESFNARDFGRVDELAAGDLEYTNVATGQTFRGPEGVGRRVLGRGDRDRQPARRG
jgi:hypothetical protein